MIDGCASALPSGASAAGSALAAFDNTPLAKSTTPVVAPVTTIAMITAMLTNRNSLRTGLRW